MQKILKPLLAVKTKSGYSILTTIVVTLFSTWVIFDATKAEVVIAADGEEQVVKTHTTTVGELLDDMGIEVSEHDDLSHEENTEVVDGMTIHFDAADEILLTIDGETEEFYTTANTVGEFFEDEELTFKKHDEISHSDMALLEEGLEIEVEKAFPVIVNDGGEEEKLWTTGGTVEELLKENDLTFKKSDKIKPDLDEKVTKDTEVSITHVEKITEEITESIPYQTEEKEDSSLEKGTTQTISEGEEGEVLKIYEVTLENGEKVDEELIGEEVKEESQNKVVAVGTKEEAQKKEKTTSNSDSSNSSATNSSSEPSSDGKELTMEATAYGPDCDGCSGITATGINIKQNPTPKVVAVDPSVIPLGSRVWVEGYGEAIAADTGGAIKGNRIDVLVKSEAYAANNWGRRTVKVKILD